MKANTIYRIGAYIVDVVLIAFLVSIITSFVPQSDKYKESVEKENKLLDSYFSNDVTIDEMLDDMYELRYNIDKETVHVTLITCIAYLAYFGTFAYYKDGETIGKKLFKIKIKHLGNSNNTHYFYLLRACLIHGVFISLLLTLLVMILNVHDYSIMYSILSVFNMVFLFTSLIVSIFREDGRGIHDLICNTMVVRQ